MCCTRLAENTGHKKSPKICHLRTMAQFCRAVSSQLRHALTIGKKILLDNTVSSTCSHNMVNFGPLAAEIGLPVWGTTANFNGFRMLASLLHRRRSTDVNQTLHDVWPSPELVQYIYIASNGILPCAEFALRPRLAFSYIGSVTAQHSSSACQPNFAVLYKAWNSGTFADDATYI